MSRGRVKFRAPFRDCAVWWCDTLHVTAPQVRAMQRAWIATLRGILLDWTAYEQYDLAGKVCAVFCPCCLCKPLLRRSVWMNVNMLNHKTMSPGIHP
jgi:hypothetical protein